MEFTLREYLDTLNGKKVLVIGMGVSNRPLIRLLLENGISVTACDKTPREKLPAEALELEKMGAELRLGDAYLEGLTGDVVFRTPGLRPDVPALERLREQGAVVTSEMEIFFRVCPCPIIAVTGSDGKTTTTTLIAEILKRSGKTVWIGGNIGQPLLALANQIRPEHMAVVELSSFQLMTMDRSAHVAVITNLAPNHLNVHTGMEEYRSAKANVFRFQEPSGKLVLNGDNLYSKGFAFSARGNTSFFSRQEEQTCWLKDRTVFLRGVPILNCEDIRLPGKHNVENYMAAILATEDYASPEDVLWVARNFAGVEHRIELVRTLRGVRYYNDSIASSPSRTIAGLRSFDQKVILLAGGQDKHVPFDVLGEEICRRVKALVLCGDTAAVIEKAVREAPSYREGSPVICTETEFKKAVETAASLAKDGDIVTLSPACTAFDRFANFAERGKVFKKLVMELE